MVQKQPEKRRRYNKKPRLRKQTRRHHQFVSFNFNKKRRNLRAFERSLLTRIKQCFAKRQLGKVCMPSIRYSWATSHVTQNGMVFKRNQSFRLHHEGQCHQCASFLLGGGSLRKIGHKRIRMIRDSKFHHGMPFPCSLVVSSEARKWHPVSISLQY